MGTSLAKKHQQEAELAWKALQSLLHPDILQAPRLEWSHVDPKLVRYLYQEGRDAPWLNQLALVLLVLTCHTSFDPRTISGHLYALQSRWRCLFSAYQIRSFEEWEPSKHLALYLNDTQFSDTFGTRQHFLVRYCSIAQQIAAYLRSLSQDERQRYQHWALPGLPVDLRRHLSRDSIWRSEMQQRRKQETDALAPHFARIRGEAHLRWNQLKRLKEKFCEAITLVESGQEVLPLAFSYEEARIGQRLHFRLWDRYSFFENHADHYSYRTWKEYNRKASAFSPEKNHFFLEFVHAQRLSDGVCEPDALLWFGELLRHGLLPAGRHGEKKVNDQHKLDFLRSWGYLEENGNATRPFAAPTPGLLNWSELQSRFLLQAQSRCRGLLFHVEPLFAAATFGLAALDFFTTTGARNGELIQLSLDQSCLYTLEVEGTPRFLVRLIPKGSDTPANYVVGAETLKNLERVGDLLQEHYQLQAGESIPSLDYNHHNGRAHLFKKARPYLFQFNRQQLTEASVNACIRFLMHGLVFQTAEGRTVILKAHALRHVFATHLHHVEAVPLDVIAVMLHQKNVEVTAYYAAPPWQQVLATANTLLDKFATHLGSLEEAFTRAPAELRRQLEEAKAQVGSLNKIPGGDCTCHAICPIGFACTGCVYNVPDPDREEEIMEQQQWAHVRLDQVKKRGQRPEIVKMQALIQRCQVTRQEMQLMRTYRKDEADAPTLTIERAEQRAQAVVTQTLPGKTPEDGHAGQGQRRSARQRTTIGDD